MAKKTSAMTTTKTGEPIRVYAAVTSDGGQVMLWHKRATLGFWNLERLEGGALTARSLRILIGEESA